MSEDDQFDEELDNLDNLKDIESMDEFTQLLGNGHPGSCSARRRIEELKEERLLRKLLDNDYPEIL